MEKKTGEIVVLTGAAGFVGHHTLKLLVSKDPTVTEIRCLDLVEPEPLMVSIIEEELNKVNERENAKISTKQQPQTTTATTTTGKKIVTWIKGDIRDVNIVEQTLDGAHCIIHCAAKVGFNVNPSDQDEDEMESINVGGTENLLKAAIRLGVPKFIHVSSFEVYSGLDTLYYCTEATLPEIKYFIYGASGRTKHQAEAKVKQYSNTKLMSNNNHQFMKTMKSKNSNQTTTATATANKNSDALNAVIIRFPITYGEFDKYYITKILEAAKFFGGKLQRLNNIWIRQQPIYVVNAAWSLLKAKQRMDRDQSISGEEFHVTDETTIGDPFDFVEPYLECKNMHVTKNSYSSFPIWILLLLFFAIKKFLCTLDVFNLFTTKKGRLQDAIEKDELKHNSNFASLKAQRKQKVWYDYVNPVNISTMTASQFLNRTKASLRLDYDPIIDPKEATQNSINWYKNHLEL